jgi:hypothetical protein
MHSTVVAGRSPTETWIGPMNVLSRDKQIEVICALTEGLGIRATARITGVNRETVGTLALRVGRGCAELHDRIMVGIRTNRIECDEMWAYVGHKRNPQKGPARPSPVRGDQYTYVALASSTRAILAYRTGKRTTETTDDFIQDLRQRVIGVPGNAHQVLDYCPYCVHYGQWQPSQS